MGIPSPGNYQKDILQVINNLTILAALSLALLGNQAMAQASENFCGPFHHVEPHVEISGRAYVYLHSHPKVEGENRPFFETEASLIFQKSISSKIFFKLSSRFQIDNDHKSKEVIDGLKNNEKQRRMFDIDEGFLEYRSIHFDLFAGKRILSWGKGDHFNPSDMINPRDYTDFLDSEKIGLFLAGTTLYPNDLSQLGLVYSPCFTRSRIYLTDSRWAVCGPWLQIREEIPSAGLYAMRYSLYLNNLDLEFIYMNKHENLPTLLLISPDTVLEKHRKMDLFSIEGSTTVAEAIELHGGAAYRHIDHKTLYGRFFQYLIGINYTVDQKIFFHKQINISCEYLGKGDIDQPDSRLMGLDFIRLFEDSLFIQAGIALTGFSDFTLSNLFCFDQILNDILRLEYRYTPNCKLELGFGADFIWGDGNFIFEQFEKNDRTWVKVQYTL